MKCNFRASWCVAGLLVVAVFAMFGWCLLKMQSRDFGTSISVVSCPGACFPSAQRYVQSKDLPQSIKDKIIAVINEDSKFAIFDFNSYAYSTGITAMGNGYKVYLFKKFTVYEGPGLGQYSAKAGALHRLYYDELFEYIRKHGKPK